MSLDVSLSLCCSEAILADLKAGTTVVCDRYAFSGIAFSAIKVR